MKVCEGKEESESSAEIKGEARGGERGDEDEGDNRREARDESASDLVEEEGGMSPDFRAADGDPEEGEVIGEETPEAGVRKSPEGFLAGAKILLADRGAERGFSLLASSPRTGASPADEPESVERAEDSRL